MGVSPLACSIDATIACRMKGSMPEMRHGLGDATGARSDPLAKWVLYYSTHLAFIEKLISAIREQWQSGYQVRI